MNERGPPESMAPWGFTGIAIALLAVGFVAAYGHMHGLAWVAPLLAAWAIAAPWVVAGDTPETAAIVSNVIVGAVALLCALAMMSTDLRRGVRR